MSSEIGHDSSGVHETKETVIRRFEEKPTRVRSSPSRAQPWITPQDAIDKSWARSSVKIFSAATTVLPVSDPEGSDHQQASQPPEQGQLVAANFEEAAKVCKQKVEKIVKEHQRVNQRYRDSHFDIDIDLKSRKGICIGTLTEPTRWVFEDGPDIRPNGHLPKSVKRLDVSTKLHGFSSDNDVDRDTCRKFLTSAKRHFHQSLHLLVVIFPHDIEHV